MRVLLNFTTNIKPCRKYTHFHRDDRKNTRKVFYLHSMQVDKVVLTKVMDVLKSWNECWKKNDKQLLQIITGSCLKKLLIYYAIIRATILHKLIAFFF